VCKHGGLANLRRVGGTHDGGHPLEEVVALGPGGAVARRIQADLRKLLLDSAAQGDHRHRVTQVESENVTRVRKFDTSHASTAGIHQEDY
jgi:hypothetical protein